MTGKENRAWGKAHGVSVGMGKNDMPPNANGKTRKLVLRRRWVKERLPNESFSDWKKRVYTEN